MMVEGRSLEKLSLRDLGRRRDAGGAMEEGLDSVESVVEEAAMVGVTTPMYGRPG